MLKKKTFVHQRRGTLAGGPASYRVSGTHFIFFFPSNLLLREATVRPVGRGGGGGASGARASTWVTDGVSGGGIDGRPRAPGVTAAAAEFFLPRRRGVPSTSDLVVETAGRTDVASSGGNVGACSRRRVAVASEGPFKLGSSSASCSASWSESISLEAETPLPFFLDLLGFGFDLGLSSAFRGSSLGSGSFFGDISIRYSG